MPTQRQENLANEGLRYALNTRGREVVENWSDTSFAHTELSKKELEELALSIGHHRRILQGEVEGSEDGGFPSRAGGLKFAIKESNRLLERINKVNKELESPDDIARLDLSQFDFINTLGTNSYQRITDDHVKWMDRLNKNNPAIINKSPLLQFFTNDFQELNNAHDMMQTKTINAVTESSHNNSSTSSSFVPLILIGGIAFLTLLSR